MKKTGELDIRGTLVRVVKINGEDYVSLTDMAKLKSEDAQQTISNWMRNRMTLEYLGLWEELYNPDFKPLGFEGFRKEVGLNHFTMSPSKWIDGVNGLKAKEQELIGWSAKRELAKINYRIHTDAIKEKLIPAQVSRVQMSIIYASEADVLNVALFGMTHQQWQAQNPELKGNQRDYATVNQLICISNMENINAVMINDGIPQPQRLKKLNEIAIQQMRILSEVDGRKYLK